MTATKPAVCSLLFLVLGFGAGGGEPAATFAGTDSEGFSGDGGPASAAAINNAFFIHFHAATGDVFISDGDNHRIRKVNTAGIITTIAGTGSAGFSGDGGPAATARIAAPRGITVDGAGNVLFCDRDNQRVRRVTPAGVIETVAGNGVDGFSGDGGPAVAASLSQPRGVAVDGLGGILIADTGNNRIRRVDPGGIISTIAGKDASGFSGDGGPAVQAALNEPFDVAVDNVGGVIIADNNNNRIRRIDPSGGVISTIAGTGVAGYSGDGGLAVAAELAAPVGLALGARGHIVFADRANRRVRVISPEGRIGSIDTNVLLNPFDVAVTSNSVLVADVELEKIKRIGPLLPPVVSGPQTASGTVGDEFNFSLATSGSTPMLVEKTGVPPGLFADNATLKGVPTQAGTFNVNYTVYNLAGTASGTVVVTISPPPPNTVSASLKMSDSYKDTVKLFKEEGGSFPEEFSSGKYTIQATLTGVQAADFVASTVFAFRLANFEFTALLGDANKFEPGKSALFLEQEDIGEETERLITRLSVSLKFSGDKVSIKISGKAFDGEPQVLAETFAGQPSQEITQGHFTRILLGSARATLKTAVTGTVSTVTKLVGKGEEAEEFDLSSVKLKGAGTGTVP